MVNTPHIDLVGSKLIFYSNIILAFKTVSMHPYHILYKVLKGRILYIPSYAHSQPYSCISPHVWFLYLDFKQIQFVRVYFLPCSFHNFQTYISINMDLFSKRVFSCKLPPMSPMCNMAPTKTKQTMSYLTKT